MHATASAQLTRDVDLALVSRDVWRMVTRGKKPSWTAW